MIACCAAESSAAMASSARLTSAAYVSVVGGNSRDGSSQVGATAFIACPAGDADEQAEREIGFQFNLSSGEAMRHAALQGAGEFPQDRGKILMRIALVKKHRLAGFDGDRQLSLKRLALHAARRQVPIVIQSAFPDRHHVRLLQQREPLIAGRAGVRLRIVGMHAGGAP